MMCSVCLLTECEQLFESNFSADFQSRKRTQKFSVLHISFFAIELRGGCHGVTWLHDNRYCRAAGCSLQAAGCVGRGVRGAYRGGLTAAESYLWVKGRVKPAMTSNGSEPMSFS